MLSMKADFLGIGDSRENLKGNSLARKYDSTMHALYGQNSVQVVCVSVCVCFYCIATRIYPKRDT